MSDSSLNTNTQLEHPGSEQQANRDEAFVVTHPWIQHYQPGVSAHLEIPDQPLTWLLDRTTLIYYGARLSYAQLAQGANRFAIALQRLGVNKGERVALALPNIPQYPIAFFRRELRAGV